MTDQTFDLSGSFAATILSDVTALQVYTGVAPAGCQPELRTATITVRQAGRTLRFVSFCDLVQTSANTDPQLSSTPVLEGDLTSAFASLTPTRSVDPPKNGQLIFSLATTGTVKDKIQHPLAGQVTVTQDGVTVGSRRLAAGETWRLPVRPGIYTVTSTAEGYDCGSGDVTVAAGLLIGPGADCSPR